MYATGSYMQYPQHSRHPKPRVNRDTESVRCDVCNISIVGRDQFNSHMQGAKHARKIKEHENCKKLEDMPHVKYDEYSMGYTCSVCNVSLNSSSVAMLHVVGSRHAEAVKAYNPDAAPPKVDEAAVDSNSDQTSEKVEPQNDKSNEVAQMQNAGLPISFATTKLPPKTKPDLPGLRFAPRPNWPPRPNGNFTRREWGPPPRHDWGPPRPMNPMNRPMSPMNRPINPMMKFRHQIKPLASSFVSKYTMHDVEATVSTGMNSGPRHRPPPAAAGKGHQTFPCLACNIKTNSETQLQAHLSSEKHKNRLTPGNRQDDQPPPPPAAFTLKCESCNICVNSQIQLDQHLQSSKHRNKLSQRYRPYPNVKPA